jgi:hypothetical protein
MVLPGSWSVLPKYPHGSLQGWQSAWNVSIAEFHSGGQRKEYQ